MVEPPSTPNDSSSRVRFDLIYYRQCGVSDVKTRPKMALWRRGSREGCTAQERKKIIQRLQTNPSSSDEGLIMSTIPHADASASVVGVAKNTKTIAASVGPGQGSPEAYSLDSRSRNELASSFIEVVTGVEKALSSSPSTPLLRVADTEWNDLLCILAGTADLIVALTASGVEPESVELEMHRLSALTDAAHAVSRGSVLKAFAATPHIIEDPTVIVKQDSEALMMADNSMTPLIEAQRIYRDQCNTLRERTEFIESRLEKRVDSVFDSFKLNSTHHSASESVEFALSSTVEELDTIRKTNTMRWLNDVLKWQAIDMNIQTRKQAQIREYRQLMDVKKRRIKEMLHEKIAQSMELRNLQLANASLDSVMENLAKEAQNRSAGVSASSTAPSSPPTAVVSPQMVQSPVVSHQQQEASMMERYNRMTQQLTG